MPTTVRITHMTREYSADEHVASAFALGWDSASDVLGWRQLAVEIAWNDGVQTTFVQIDGPDQSLAEWPSPSLHDDPEIRVKLRVLGVDGWSPWSAEVLAPSQ